MLKVLDKRGAYEQQPGFDRPYRLRLYRGPSGPPVVVVTAEAFTTWLVRLGPDALPAIAARHGLDPCAAIWIAEVPGHDPADPDLDPAVAEGLTVGEEYALCTVEPYPSAPGTFRYGLCEPTTRAWVEDTLLRCALADGGSGPLPDPGLPGRIAALVRGPVGDLLRSLGVLTAPPTLDDAGSDRRGQPGEGRGAP